MKKLIQHEIPCILMQPSTELIQIERFIDLQYEIQSFQEHIDQAQEWVKHNEDSCARTLCKLARVRVTTFVNFCLEGLRHIDEWLGSQLFDTCWLDPYSVQSYK